jgi:uncharacterized protein (TIGR00369 family)
MSPARFVPQNSDFEAVVRESFGRQTLMATLGVELVHVAPGEVHLSLPYSPTLCQQNGYVHAGAIASMADSANGYAAFTLAPPDFDVLAVEFKINCWRPPESQFLACGVAASGADTDDLPGFVCAVTQGRTPIATMLSTIIVDRMQPPGSWPYPP